MRSFIRFIETGIVGIITESIERVQKNSTHMYERVHVSVSHNEEAQVKTSQPLGEMTHP